VLRHAMPCCAVLCRTVLCCAVILILATWHCIIATTVISHEGFVFQQLTSRAASLDLKDPRPPAACKAFLRKACSPATAYANETLLFEFTRKKFHDSFPLPYVVEDVAQFLLVRQEYAYIGYSWMGCIQPNGFVQGNATGYAAAAAQ
jgi:hypothetical protein